MLSGYEHCVGSSGVALAPCLGYDSLNVLYFLGRSKKKENPCSVNIGGASPIMGLNCRARVSVMGLQTFSPAIL
jgi:hypothetical protein